MSQFLLPLVATLLCLASCTPCKSPCPNRYCPPSAPTRPICPEATPACRQQRPSGGCRQQQKTPTSRACRQRKPVTLYNLTDIYPGIAPDRVAI